MESDGEAHTKDGTWTVFLVFLRLGLTSFGGPAAHLGYFREEFVARRRWLNECSYADLVALCQFLPGPASSQVGMALGMFRSGFGGALAAWAGFTLPSAILLSLFAMGLSIWGGAFPPGGLHGLKVVAVAVVAQAVWGMARHLCTDAARATIAVTSACIALMWPDPLAQVTVIAVAAMIGIGTLRTPKTLAHEPLPVAIDRRMGIALLVLFFGLLADLPILSRAWPNHTLALINDFYRAGSLVFGGGHVVLPLLQAIAVPPGWVSNDAFLAGYGIVQAAPGPLFSFAAFVGASMEIAPSGWLGAAICLLSIFAPSFLLVFGALPFWESLRRSPRAQAALSGVNAAVVGLLLAALYHPVWTSPIFKPVDFCLVLAAWVALVFWRLPPWLVVVGSGAAGWAASLVL